MNQEEREAAKARCEAATDGPWRTGIGTSPKVTSHLDGPVCDVYNSNDDAFIAHSRTDLPAALAGWDAAEESMVKQARLLSESAAGYREEAEQWKTECEPLLDFLTGSPALCDSPIGYAREMQEENLHLRAKLAECQGLIQKYDHAIVFDHHVCACHYGGHKPGCRTAVLLKAP